MSLALTDAKIGYHPRSIAFRSPHSPLTGSPDITETAQAVIVDIATKAQAVAQAAADTLDQNRRTAARALADAATAIHDGEAHLPGGKGLTRLAEASAKEIDATAQSREHTTQQMMPISSSS